MNVKIDPVLEREYVSGQYSDSFPELLHSYELKSSEVVAGLPVSCLNRLYGLGEREVFDFFPARIPAMATMIYFHAGYWQSRDKSTFRFISRSLNLAGVNVALVNYPLCPNVNIGDIIASARKAIHAVLGITAKGDTTPPLILAGHSAGAHLAVEMALHDWGGYKECRIAGLLAISGLYDLQPLIATSLNKALRLDQKEARKLSPAFRAKHTNIPAIFAVGAFETREFHWQSEQMHNHWLHANNPGTLLTLANEDHFSILRSFVEPNGKFLESCLAFLK